MTRDEFKTAWAPLIERFPGYNYAPDQLERIFESAEHLSGFEFRTVVRRLLNEGRPVPRDGDIPPRFDHAATFEKFILTEAAKLPDPEAQLNIETMKRLFPAEKIDAIIARGSEK